MELILEKLKEKFEYINFEEEDIKTCLNNAIEKCKKNNNDNEINMRLSINDYFITELAPLISSGREDILIAIQFAYEYELEFFMRKRNIKEKNKKIMKAYEISIMNAIIDTEKGSFTSKLINNLIKLNKLQEEEMTKMNYDMKDKNLYEIFANYNKEYVNMILSTMKKREERTYLKLISIFGPNFDKKLKTTDISYFQKLELNNKLNWFESKLKLTRKLISKGKTLAEVKDILIKQSDSNIINLMSEEKDNVQTFKNKKEILDYFNINKKELDDSIGFLENKEAMTVFKYAFGIGVQPLTKKEIMEKMNITDSKYNELIDYVYKNIEQAIKEYREYIKSFKESKEKKEPKEKKIKEEPKKDNKKSFFDNLLDNVPEDQKETYKDIIKTNIFNSNSIVAKNILALYGEDLESYNEDILLTKKELQNIRTYKHTIRKKIIDGKLLPRLQKTKPSKQTNNKLFFDGMFDGLSKELIEEYKRIIITNVNSSNSEVTKNIIKLYGENLDKYNYDVELNQKEKLNISVYRSTLKKKIKNGELKSIRAKKERKVIEKEKKIVLFFDNIFNETLTEQEIEEYKRIIISLVHSSNSNVAKNIIKLYGDKLDEYNSEIKLNKNEKMNINCYKSSIRKKIAEGKLIEKPIHKETKTKEKNNNKIFEKNKFFIYRIVSQNTPSEDLKRINDELYKILPEYHEYMGYKVAKTLYGEELKDPFKNRKLSTTEKGQFYFFIRTIKKRLEMSKPNSLIIEEPKVKEDIKPETIEVIKKQNSHQNHKTKEEIKNQIKLDYIEELIYSLYVDEKCDPIVISKIISINVEDILSILIKMYPVLPNKLELVDYITLNYPNKIKELLNIEYIKKGLSNCTNNELKVIYLKLLSRSNPLITDLYITKLTGLDENTVKNYKLMTKDDSINELGELIMKKKKTDDI